MIPRLYENTDTTWTTFGICPLPDAISCYVTEERNGEYTLAMEYPRGGQWANEIIVDRIILADPYDGATHAQPFRIREVTFDMAGNMVIQAEHISYQLNNVIIGIGTYNYTTAATMWSAIAAGRIAGTNPFTFSSDIATVRAFGIEYQEPAPFRRVLGGEVGSMQYMFGGEFEWDRYTVNLHASRGADNGVKIAYTKNLTGLTYDIDMTDLVTGVVAFWKDENDHAQNAQATTNDYAFNHFEIVNATESFPVKPTTQELKTWAQNWLASNAKDPELSVEVQFIPLWQTEEYKEFAALEHVALCDTVEVIYPPLNIDVKAKVVRTVYDVLMDRYTELTISTLKKSLADTICDLMKG